MCLRAEREALCAFVCLGWRRVSSDALCHRVDVYTGDSERVLHTLCLLRVSAWSLRVGVRACPRSPPPHPSFPAPCPSRPTRSLREHACASCVRPHCVRAGKATCVELMDNVATQTITIGFPTPVDVTCVALGWMAAPSCQVRVHVEGEGSATPGVLGTSAAAPTLRLPVPPQVSRRGALRAPPGVAVHGRRAVPWVARAAAWPRCVRRACAGAGR